MRELNSFTELHNKEFSAALRKLESHLRGFKYSIFDSHTFFSERMNDPSKYGMKLMKILHNSCRIVLLPTSNFNSCFHFVQVSRMGRWLVVVQVRTEGFPAVEGEDQ